MDASGSMENDRQTLVNLANLLTAKVRASSVHRSGEAWMTHAVCATLQVDSLCSRNCPSPPADCGAYGFGTYVEVRTDP
jgi:hypothetical protein